MRQEEDIGAPAGLVQDRGATRVVHALTNTRTGIQNLMGIHTHMSVRIRTHILMGILVLMVLLRMSMVLTVMMVRTDAARVVLAPRIVGCHKSEKKHGCI